jgi:hypothetical protein
MPHPGVGPLSDQAGFPAKAAACSLRTSEIAGLASHISELKSLETEGFLWERVKGWHQKVMIMSLRSTQVYRQWICFYLLPWIEEEPCCPGEFGVDTKAFQWQGSF